MCYMWSRRDYQESPPQRFCVFFLPQWRRKASMTATVQLVCSQADTYTVLYIGQSVTYAYVTMYSLVYITLVRHNTIFLFPFIVSPLIVLFPLLLYWCGAFVIVFLCLNCLKASKKGAFFWTVMRIWPLHPDGKPQLCHWLLTSVTAAMLFLILNDILTENNFKAWTFVKNPFTSNSSTWNRLHPPSPWRASKAERLQCFIQSVMCYCCRLEVRQPSGRGSLSEDVIPEEVSPSSQRCGWARVWGGGWEGPLTATPPCHPAPHRSRSPSRGSEEGSTVSWTSAAQRHWQACLSWLMLGEKVNAFHSFIFYSSFLLYSGLQGSAETYHSCHIAS